MSKFRTPAKNDMSNIDRLKEDRMICRYPECTKKLSRLSWLTFRRGDSTGLCKRHGHWSTKPKDETEELREKLSENGRRVMEMINADGRAFRMPKGHHTKEHRERMSKLMTGRHVTWGDKIRESHWSRKSNEEVEEIIEKIQRGDPQKKGTHKGYFSSFKTGDLHFYASSYELRRMTFLENADAVKTFKTRHGIVIPYILKDQARNYLPDILVEYHDGRQFLEEIKGFVRERDKFDAKCAAAIDFCRDNKMIYRVLYDCDLGVL
ncbi:hypothetical protein HN588_15500 [Candidatus Bathyarchaeota archaeon]|jgi:hypothetical protein|nr:hypothetical protein [Candidatus Bathyarchaeota archaeon]